MPNNCSFCDSTTSLIELYSGDDVDEEDKKVICRRCIKDEQVEFCRLCGEDIAYYLDDLDHNSLCSEHSGEFDLDEEEEQDMADFIEYHTKDN